MLDIEKAYDHLNWGFLLEVLGKMGFGMKWLAWIKWCISSVFFFVLLNGCSTNFFKSSRGLRQGDPLSPFLFVIGMEAFSRLIYKAVMGGFLSDYKHRNRVGEEIIISHLLFADDTVIFL